MLFNAPLEGARLKSLRLHFSTYQLQNRHLTSKLKSEILGKEIHPSLKSFFEERLKAVALEEGFPKARLSKIQVDKDHEQGDEIWDVWVDEAEPCHLSHIVLPYDLPENVKLGLSLGSLCRVADLKAAVDKCEDEIHGASYIDGELNYGGLVYDPDGKSAVLHITGHLGKKVQYVVKEIASKTRILWKDKSEIFDPAKLTPESFHGEVVKFYQSQGYDEVQVLGPFTKENAGEKIYECQVKPGIRFFVGDVKFDGAEAFSEDELGKILDLSPRWAPFPIMNRENWYEKLDHLAAWYQKQGYWDVKISLARVQYDRKKSLVSLGIRVQEGLPRVLASFTLKKSEEKGNPSWLPPLGISLKSKFSQDDLFSWEEKCKKNYESQGYIHGQIRMALKEEMKKDALWIHVQAVEERGALSLIRHINYVGLERTHPKILERELSFRSGEPYIPDNLLISKNKILSLGLVRSVHILPLEKEANFWDIDIIVQESDVGNLSFGPGFNLQKGMQYMAEVGFHNLMGTGRQLSLRASLSQEKDQKALKTDGKHQTLLGRKIGVGYVEPYVLGWPWHGKLSLFHRAIADDLWKMSSNLEASLVTTDALSKDYLRKKCMFFYNLKNQWDVGSQEQRDVLIATGGARIGSLGLQLQLDTRDQPVWASRGMFWLGEMSWARYGLGGDFHYFKWDWKQQHYVPWGPFVLAAGAWLTSYEGIKRLLSKKEQVPDVLPSSERLLAGGQNKVRGFVHQLGPYILLPQGRLDPSGGSRRVLLKGEIKWQVVKNQWGMSLFLDSGNSFFSPEEVEKFQERFSEFSEPARPQLKENYFYDFKELFSHPSYVYRKHYLSGGLATSALTPLGSIHLALVWPLKEPSSEESSFFSRRSRKDTLWWRQIKLELSMGSDF